MKLFTALLVLAVSVSAHATEQAAKPAVYTTGQNDCLGVAVITQGVAIAYTQGANKDAVVNKLSERKRMDEPGYKAMYPTIKLAVDDIYSNQSMQTVYETYVNPCLANVGKPPLH